MYLLSCIDMARIHFSSLLLTVCMVLAEANSMFQLSADEVLSRTFVAESLMQLRHMSG